MTGAGYGNELQKVLKNLETRLEAYLTEWREQLGFQEEAEAGIARDEQSSAPTKREKKGVETNNRA